MNEKNLSAKEWLFCRYFIRTNNAREAAARSGYIMFPEKCGEKLLRKEKIRKEINRASSSENISEREIVAGLKRLAFGSISDAIKIVLQDDLSVSTLEEFDLYNISEIKRAKGGGVEVKFFDRLKALDKLMEISSDSKEGSAEAFFDALRKSTQDED